MNKNYEELKGKSGIYVIRNISNNKAYIGSAVDLHKRKILHYCELRGNKHHNRHLQSAYNKYGEDNFVFEVLTYIDNKEELITIETKYIQLFEVCNPDIGYNICHNGRSSLGIKRSEESKQKMRDAQKGRKISEEHKKKLSESHIGKIVSNETREKKSIPVVKLDKETRELISEYFGSSEASRQTGINRSNILSVCRGKYKTAGGYNWQYAKDYYKKQKEVA